MRSVVGVAQAGRQPLVADDVAEGRFGWCVRVSLGTVLVHFMTTLFASIDKELFGAVRERLLGVDGVHDNVESVLILLLMYLVVCLINRKHFVEVQTHFTIVEQKRNAYSRIS